MSEPTILEVKTGEHTYQFVCSPDSPIGEVYDALSNMRAYVIQKIKESEDKQDSEEKVQSCCA